MNVNVPDIRISQAQLQPDPGSPNGQSQADAPAAEVSAIRSFLLSRGNSAFTDRAFSWLMLLCALSIFAIVALIALELVRGSQLTWHKFGVSFFYREFSDPDTHLPLFWDPVNQQFSARPFVYGTLVSSFLSSKAVSSTTFPVAPGGDARTYAPSQGNSGHG